MSVRRTRREPDHAPLTFVDATHIRVGRRRLLYFGGCDYLGLAWHPDVRASMRKALTTGPTQTGASRTTTGEHRIYFEVEQALARFFQFPAAALVSCGYLAPLAALQALRPWVGSVVLNSESHACVRDAAAASGLPLLRMTDSHPDSLVRCLKRLPQGSRPVLLTDGTFGIRGGMAPVDAYLRHLPRRGWMVVDDAHGAGVVGPGGRGIVARYGIQDPRVAVTMSLAKAVGVSGGAVLGTGEVIQSLRKAGPYVGSTAMPLAIPSGILAALRVIRREPGRIRRAQALQRRLFERLPEHPAVRGCPETPVTAVNPSSPTEAEAVRRALLDAGILPTWIRYPGGAADGFFRFAVSAEHMESEVDLLAGALSTALEVWPKGGGLTGRASS
ncbi:MAG: aminotransferase class I/II-fold pyridoxal phosphate-dependent enzyme [Verrucomicrobiales bacterium]|nr:aminotransferase class I/II-fold pyridoxal phosphate-dependent enzyme [Verrucomicrobiales bacterium]